MVIAARTDATKLHAKVIPALQKELMDRDTLIKVKDTTIKELFDQVEALQSTIGDLQSRLEPVPLEPVPLEHIPSDDIPF
jgi:hypothetical protein